MSEQPEPMDITLNERFLSRYRMIGAAADRRGCDPLEDAEAMLVVGVERYAGERGPRYTARLLYLLALKMSAQADQEAADLVRRKLS